MVVVVVLIPADRPVCLPQAGLDRFFRRVRRVQPPAPADQVGPASLDQCFADGALILRPRLACGNSDRVAFGHIDQRPERPAGIESLQPVRVGLHLGVLPQYYGAARAKVYQ